MEQEGWPGSTTASEKLLNVSLCLHFFFKVLKGKLYTCPVAPWTQMLCFFSSLTKKTLPLLEIYWVHLPSSNLKEHSGLTLTLFAAVL